MVIYVVTSRLSRWPNSFYSYYLSRPFRSEQHRLWLFRIKVCAEGRGVNDLAPVEHLYEMKLTFEPPCLPYNYWIQRSLSNGK